MKHSFNTNASGKRQQIEGVLANLRRDFNKLAPNPDQPGKEGPQLVRDSGHGRDNHEGMLATIVVEGFLGGVYGDAVLDALDAPAWAADVDWAKALENYDEYNKDRATTPAKQGDNADLTMIVQRAPMTMDEFIDRAMRRAWQDDLPARMKLEGSFAHFSAMLDQLEMGQFDFDTPVHKMKNFAPKMAA